MIKRQTDRKNLLTHQIITNKRKIEQKMKKNRFSKIVYNNKNVSIQREHPAILWCCDGVILTYG